MNAETTDITIRRIAVALDASEHSQRALETAARLAASLKAELEGIFVEDIDLIHLAGLPFLREIRLASLAQEAVNLQRMERELRAIARQVRQTLEFVAQREGISCSFRVRRGRVEAELMEAAMEVDVLTLGRAGAPLSHRLRLRVQESVIATPPRPGQRRTPPSVVVTFSGSENAKRALLAAANLAEREALDITVVIPDVPDTEARRLQALAESLLRSQKQRVGFVRLTGNGVQDLINAVGSCSSQVLIVERDTPLLEGDALWRCLNQVGCPVLLVR
jgi:nucleotide-binding universal stress UspA family protein